MAHVARDDAERLLAVRLLPPLLPFAATHSHRRCSPPCLARERAPGLIPHAQAISVLDRASSVLRPHLVRYFPATTPAFRSQPQYASLKRDSLST